MIPPRTDPTIMGIMSSFTNGFGLNVGKIKGLVVLSKFGDVNGLEVVLAVVVVVVFGLFVVVGEVVVVEGPLVTSILSPSVLKSIELEVAKAKRTQTTKSETKMKCFIFST
jgi:hypothetical protein